MIVENKPDLRKSVEDKLVSTANGYPLEDFSVGRLLAFVAESRNLGLNLNSEELRVIGEIVKEKKKTDFEFAHRQLKKIIFDFFGKEIPDINDSNYFRKFETEYEFLEYLAQSEQTDLRKVSNSTTKDIIKYIRKNPNSNTIKEAASRNINLYLLNTKKLGIPLELALLRDKAIKSHTTKIIERSSKSFCAGEKEFKRMLHLGYKVTQDSYQSEFRRLYLALLNQAVGSGIDCQNFRERCLRGGNNTLFQLGGEILSRVFMVDGAGEKLSIKDLNLLKKLDSHLYSYADRYGELTTRRKDNLDSGEKDLSIVRSYRDDIHLRGVYSELRLQPYYRGTILAEFGGNVNGKIVRPHYIYKPDIENGFLTLAKENAEFGQGAQDVSVAMGYSSLEDLINSN